MYECIQSSVHLRLSPTKMWRNALHELHCSSKNMSCTVQSYLPFCLRDHFSEASTAHHTHTHISARQSHYLALHSSPSVSPSPRIMINCAETRQSGRPVYPRQYTDNNKPSS